MNDTSFSMFSGIAGRIQKWLRCFLEFSELKKPQLANNVKVRDPYEWQFILSYPS
ncbi:MULTISPECIES: hypothetical protein [Agrobacterium]|uniref:Uncharacterized protein n=1 Tax=Agrobacterium tumefaciens TaxID=358 RepID=A0AAF0H2A5_AGRTU|nr:MULTISPECIES: hypothetical protein [Agrobacterium]WGM60677.1 hypothetical protein CFBP5506_00570 [Agrobacterium tumefaciens]